MVDNTFNKSDAYGRIKEFYERFTSQERSLPRSLEEKFDTTFAQRPPTFFTGHLDAPVVTLGLNPGHSGRKNEETGRYDSFDEYVSACSHFFEYRAQHYEGDLPYYRTLFHLIRGLRDDPYKESPSSNEYLSYLSETLLNLDLIPYHSTRFSPKEDIDLNNPRSKRSKLFLETSWASITAISS